MIGWGQSVIGWAQSVIGWGQSVIGWGQSVIGWGQSVIGWGQSVNGWGQSVIAWGQSLCVRHMTSQRWRKRAKGREVPLGFSSQSIPSFLLPTLRSFPEASFKQLQKRV